MKAIKRKVFYFIPIMLVSLVSIILVSTSTANYKFEKFNKQLRNNMSKNLLIQSSIQDKELKQNGYSIQYFVSGNPSKELIIFMHPAFADHRCFDKQIDYFSKEYRVITIDMLGHGLSVVNKAKDKIDVTINHIDAIMSIEGYTQAHIVGVSMGSLIAQFFALNYPDKVLSVTILGGYNINADNKLIAKAQRSEQIKWLLKALFSMNSFRRYVSKSVVSKPEEQARFYEMACLFTRKSFTIMPGLGKVIQLRGNIKRNYPLLILSGDKDVDLAIEMSKMWHESDATSQYRIIENAGHCANMDNAMEFNKVLMDFLTHR